MPGGLLGWTPQGFGETELKSTLSLKRWGVPPSSGPGKGCHMLRDPTYRDSKQIGTSGQSGG